MDGEQSVEGGHMSDDLHFHRRHLPHIYLPNAVYFITFRLEGSLPSHALEEIKERARLQKKARFSFVDYDKALETASQRARWLADPRIAEMLTRAMHFQDRRDFTLVAFCIMPNHVHLVIGVGECELLSGVRQVSNLSNKTVSQIVHSLKR
jgi:putative transposase